MSTRGFERGMAVGWSDVSPNTPLLLNVTGSGQERQRLFENAPFRKGDGNSVHGRIISWGQHELVRHGAKPGHLQLSHGAGPL